MIRDKNTLVLMDSHLEGNFSTEEATTLVDLASQCLQYEPRDRPDTKKLVTTLELLQRKSEELQEWLRVDGDVQNLQAVQELQEWLRVDGDVQNLQARGLDEYKICKPVAGSQDASTQTEDGDVQRTKNKPLNVSVQ
ncbi:uncharacterized protein LOC141832682 [Curcuma longa]|uniref:uncharacterized protein LOC141832682 n=1 Tax=Curcuma longa TaxID=136217 RepID=UPI003D9DD6B9